MPVKTMPSFPYHQVDSTVESKMTEVLNEYQGYSTTHEVSVGWNLLFIGVKQRLHYNVLDQRTPTVLTYFSFVDIRL